VDVVSEGEWIPKGSQVRVTLAQGNRIVVALYGEST
jgi:membrane-bound ClpP family serine protease